MGLLMDCHLNINSGFSSWGNSVLASNPEHFKKSRRWWGSSPGLSSKLIWCRPKLLALLTITTSHFIIRYQGVFSSESAECILPKPISVLGPVRNPVNNLRLFLRKPLQMMSQIACLVLSLSSRIVISLLLLLFWFPLKEHKHLGPQERFKPNEWSSCSFPCQFISFFISLKAHITCVVQCIVIIQFFRWRGWVPWCSWRRRKLARWSRLGLRWRQP